MKGTDLGENITSVLDGISGYRGAVIPGQIRSIDIAFQQHAHCEFFYGVLFVTSDDFHHADFGLSVTCSIEFEAHFVVVWIGCLDWVFGLFGAMDAGRFDFFADLTLFKARPTMANKSRWQPSQAVLGKKAGKVEYGCTRKQNQNREQIDSNSISFSVSTLSCTTAVDAECV